MLGFLPLLGLPPPFMGKQKGYRVDGLLDDKKKDHMDTMTLEQTKGKGIWEPDNLQDKRGVNSNLNNLNRSRRDRNRQQRYDDII